MSALRSPFRLPLFSVLLLISLGLDAYHFTGPYQNENLIPVHARSFRPKEQWKAYQILKTQFDKTKPVLFFGESFAHESNFALDIAMWKSNALHDSEHSLRPAQWAAFLSNVNYKPFLENKFTHLRTYSLASTPAPFDGGYALFLVPLNDANTGIIHKWISFREDLSRIHHAFYLESSSALQADYQRLLSKTEGDTFLVSVLLEKSAISYSASGNKSESRRSYEEALKRGYPAAHLYNELGVILAHEGRIPEAFVSFQKALNSPLNLTAAADNKALILQTLQQNTPPLIQAYPYH